MRFGVLVVGLVTLMPAIASAEAGFFAGLTYLMGDRPAVGFTVKALNTRIEDRGVVGLGVSYYPTLKGGPAGPFGIDLSAGYQNDNAAGLVGYDFLNNNFNLSLGYSDTKKP